MLGMKAWRPIASKFTTSTLPRIVRLPYSTEVGSYEYIKVSTPKLGVGLSAFTPMHHERSLLSCSQ